MVAIDGQLLFAPMDYENPLVGPPPGDSPIALGVRGGALTVNELRIYRDIYYTSSLADTPRHPYGTMSPVRLGDDEFFVLGDNSPVSNDSRFWKEGPVVRGLDVRGQTVPGSSSRSSRTAPGVRPFFLLGSRSSSNPLHSIVASTRVRAGRVRTEDRAAREGGSHWASRKPVVEQPRSGRGKGTRDDGTVLCNVWKPAPDLPRSKHAAAESHRDTVEAIIVAFILALVVRGFEAQAFVIPTGSMAPTLMGRHKEIACPQCGFVYAVNASEEVELRSLSRNVHSGICVNCRFQARLDETPSFKGDRILVMMFPYDLPYLPGSLLQSVGTSSCFAIPRSRKSAISSAWSACLVKQSGSSTAISSSKHPIAEKFSLARKPWKHQAAMQITAYDDRHRPRILADKSEWRRWGSENGWKIVDPAKSRYQTDGGAKDQWAELRYRHLVPDPEQWDALVNDRSLPRPPRSTLITDFYSYNTNLSADASSLLDDPRGDQEGAWMQPHWVGDLTLESTIEISGMNPNAALQFELIKARNSTSLYDQSRNR